MKQLSGKQWGVVGLAVLTAVIHLVLGIGSPEPMFKVLFVLNGLGYIVLVAALYFLQPFASNRSLIRWALMGFTAVTVILYFVFNGADAFKSVLGLVDKAIEVVLIILLWIDR
ncbi:MAG: hypothetical protein H6667_17660 [Ardenticatenaceae bacterium]|nr:hypothetical protein [Ardenticatenaceae bacterium]MCB9445381.1 hypothetical protein [Ardenticatenaceae bacterium]